LVEVVGGAGQRGEGSEVVEGGAEGVVGAGVEGKSASFSLEDARRVLFQTMLSETKASTRVRFFFFFSPLFLFFVFPDDALRDAGLHKSKRTHSSNRRHLVREHRKGFRIPGWTHDKHSLKHTHTHTPQPHPEHSFSKVRSIEDL
jgi:hypothetical protein